MRVAFLGSQPIGARCLQVILEGGHEVVGVGTFTPGEHEHWRDEVDQIVEERGLTRIPGRRFRTKKAIQALKDCEPDILFAIGWRWILGSDVLAIPPKGCLGIHGSLLPRIRGFAPVNWALIRDEPQTGPTLFYFDDGTDTGDIVGQLPFSLSDDDDAGTVRDRLADAAVELLRIHLPGLADGTAPRIVQPTEGATYGPQRRPDDGVIDWNLSPREIFNWVRGLTRPYPGAFTWLEGNRVTIWKCREVEGAGPGSGVLDPSSGANRLLVGAGTGRVEIIEASFGEDEASKGAVSDALRRVGRFDPPENS